MVQHVVFDPFESGIYDLKRAWIENEATWNEYASGQSWQVAGADGPEDRGSTVLGIMTGPVLGITTIPLNLAGVAVVQSWVDNPSSNNGFVCLDYLTASNSMDFSSREAATVAERPKLTVTYNRAISITVVPDPGDPVIIPAGGPHF